MATVKKTTKKADIMSLSQADLTKKATQLKSEAVVIARSIKEGGAQNYRAYTQKRRELARTLTALNNSPAGEDK